MKTIEIRDLLERFGYAFVVKEGEWVRCAITGHGEQWLGKGLDEETAIQDACNLMFPSKVARHFLTSQLSGAEPSKLTEKSSAEIQTQEGTAKTEPVVKKKPKLGSVKPKSLESKVIVDVRNPEFQPRKTKIYVAPPDPEPEEPKISKEEALELVQAILHEMDDSFEDLARMSSQYQRLHISSWIFRARAVEEQQRHDEVVETVHRIALRLTDWCKVFWPGSIRALQAYTQPTHALDGLIQHKTMPKTWAEAASMIDEHLSAELAKSGRDEFGWSDFTFLRPEAPNPDKVLDEAITKIESVIGGLGGSLDDKRRQVTAATVQAEMEELVLAGHLLRWVRKNANAKKWGIAMGALRWSCRQARRGSSALTSILSDTYKPEDSWAAVLGRDPELNKKNRVRKKVMEALPEENWLEEDLMEWLENAFQVFTNPEIAKLSEAVHAQIMELTNADFADADRRTRSRLHKLQSILRTRSVDLSKIKVPEPVDTEIDDDEEDTMTNRVDPTQELLKEVQKITEGKAILFVTNRPEERLHRDLERSLKAKIHYKVGDTSRTMKPIIQSVSADRYDMVLMAAAFSNHTADTALCRATKAEGLPYIRVQKGRLASTIRAIGRAYHVQKSDAEQNNVVYAG